MGNCIRKGSSAEWGGDDWGSFGSGHEKTRKEEEEKEEEVDGLPASTTDCLGAGKEVKIKISKKELDKLLKEADVEGLPLQQVLANLVNAGEPHQRSWTPALRTIPE